MSTFSPLPLSVLHNALPDDGSCPVVSVPDRLNVTDEKAADWSNTKLRLSDEVLAERRAKKAHRFERFIYQIYLVSQHFLIEFHFQVQKVCGTDEHQTGRLVNCGVQKSTSVARFEATTALSESFLAGRLVLY